MWRRVFEMSRPRRNSAEGPLHEVRWPTASGQERLRWHITELQYAATCKGQAASRVQLAMARENPSGRQRTVLLEALRPRLMRCWQGAWRRWCRDGSARGWRLVHGAALKPLFAGVHEKRALPIGRKGGLMATIPSGTTKTTRAVHKNHAGKIPGRGNRTKIVQVKTLLGGLFTACCGMSRRRSI